MPCCYISGIDRFNWSSKNDLNQYRIEGFIHGCHSWMSFMDVRRHNTTSNEEAQHSSQNNGGRPSRVRNHQKEEDEEMFTNSDDIIGTETIQKKCRSKILSHLKPQGLIRNHIYPSSHALYSSSMHSAKEKNSHMHASANVKIIGHIAQASLE